MSILSRLKGSLTPADTLQTAPWKSRPAPGVYRNGNELWLFRQLPLTPLQWEDPGKRLEAGKAIETALIEVGKLSKDLGRGVRTFSRNRQIHIRALSYTVPSGPPAGTPGRLVPFLDEVLESVTAAKAVLFGVRIESSTMDRVTSARGGLRKKFRAILDVAAESNDEDLGRFSRDSETVSAILGRCGFAVPTAEADSQLKAWFNRGITPDVGVLAAPDHLQVIGGQSFQFTGVREFELPQHRSPNAQWILDAMTHQEPAMSVSLRAELEPASVTRARLRRRRRSLREQQEEEAKTGDIGRDENDEQFAMATDLEAYVRQTGTAWLTRCSVVMASRVTEAHSTWRDMLYDRYGIRTEIIEHRQLEALAETLPCGKRANPFEHDLNPAMVAYAGLPAFSNLGDATGAFAGYVDPDYVPLFLDPGATARENTVPVMGVFGDPGSGKTFFSQLVVGQHAIAGETAVFVNPKSADSLAPWANWCRSMGVNVTHIVLSGDDSDAGGFDPFRYCSPVYAAEILTRHISTTLLGAFSYEQEIVLQDGLRRGAEAGARCAGEALSYVEDEYVQRIVRMKAASSQLFALGFAATPQPRWGATGGLTLIEFGRDLPLPQPGKSSEFYEPQEREAVAAMRLVTRAAIEILIQSQGGVLAVDEAHHFLGSDEGMKSLDRLAREGRSMKLLPIFITQRVTDLLEVDMESFLSRVLVMKLNDHRQARAALQLCRLNATPERLEFLRTSGPQLPVDGQPARSAYGIFRDQRNRHAVVSIGPVPEPVRLAMSTNPDDRDRRRDSSTPPSGGTTEGE